MKTVSETARNKGGFTIFEVIIAGAIVAILGSVAIAGFSAWLPGSRLKSAARDLYSNLQRTKMTAIKNNGSCSITYSQGPDSYFVTGVTKTVVLSEYGSGVKFAGPQGQSFSVATITFNPRGTCNAGYAYLTDQNNTSYYRVGPSWSSGMIKLEQYVSGQWR